MDRRQLKQHEKDLLEYSAGDLIPMLINAPDLLHVKQCAFGYYDNDTKQEFQVQVTVTRCKSDFLEAFQTEELSNYKKGN